MFRQIINNYMISRVFFFLGILLPFILLGGGEIRQGTRSLRTPVAFSKEIQDSVRSISPSAIEEIVPSTFDAQGGTQPAKLESRNRLEKVMSGSLAKAEEKVAKLPFLQGEATAQDSVSSISPPKREVLGVLGFVFTFPLAILAFAIFPPLALLFVLAGFVLATVSLIKIYKHPKRWKGKGLAWFTLLFWPGLFLLLAILIGIILFFAITNPNAD